MRRLFSFAGVGLAAVAFAALLSSEVLAQGPGGRGSFFGGGGGGLELLRSEDVRKELELVDDQVEKLTKLGEDFRGRMREMFSGMRDLNEEERRAKFEEIREKMRTQGEELRAQVDEILLPHQRDRLNQIRLQTQIRSGGASRALTSDRIAETLGLSEDQVNQVREKREELERDLREKIEELRSEAQDELLKILTPEQRSKWESMIGDRFEGNAFGGFRGRGGPGGGRPGEGDRRGRDSDRPARPN